LDVPQPSPPETRPSESTHDQRSTKQTNLRNRHLCAPRTLSYRRSSYFILQARQEPTDKYLLPQLPAEVHSSNLANTGKRSMANGAVQDTGETLETIQISGVTTSIFRDNAYVGEI
jgi:hypothetical protein